MGVSVCFRILGVKGGIFLVLRFLVFFDLFSVFSVVLPFLVSRPSAEGDDDGKERKGKQTLQDLGTTKGKRLTKEIKKSKQHSVYAKASRRADATWCGFAKQARGICSKQLSTVMKKNRMAHAENARSKQAVNAMGIVQ